MGRGKHLNGKIKGGGSILTREQTLRLLSEMAKNGSVTAAIALERALRLVRATTTIWTTFGPSSTASGRLASRGLMAERPAWTG